MLEMKRIIKKENDLYNNFVVTIKVTYFHRHKIDLWQVELSG